MKTIILGLAILATGIFTAIAQDGERIFKKFKGDVSLGYAAPLGSAVHGGIVFAMEPKFALMDKLSIGLRMEGAVFGDFSNAYFAQTANGTDSYLATADYYFSTNYSFRPFAGAGTGVFILKSDMSNYGRTTATKFGGIVRLGAEVKHFRLGIEYNFVPDTYLNDYNTYPGTATTKSKNSYIGIKAGFCFGGGPR